jgi:hypothetical protein
MEPTLTRIFVKPATPATLVRKPVGGYLAAEGQEVNLDSFWMRRIADGDVVGAPATAEALKPLKKP